MENKTNENSIVTEKGVVEGVLTLIGATKEVAEKIAPPLVNAIKEYGVGKRELITKTVTTVVPEFGKFSCKFFDVYELHIKSQAYRYDAECRVVEKAIDADSGNAGKIIKESVLVKTVSEVSTCLAKGFALAVTFLAMGYSANKCLDTYGTHQEAIAATKKKEYTFFKL